MDKAAFFFRGKNSESDVSNQLFLGLKWGSFSVLEKLTIVLIIASPSLYLGVKHWITNISILASICALYSVLRSQKASELIENKKIAFIFLAYTIAIFISQLGRIDFLLRDYLDQSRWLIGLPFFAFIYYTKINYAKVLDWAAPICTFSAFISSIYLIPSDAWGGRATVSFIDPLAFGFMNLSIGLMCFSSAVVDVSKRNFSVNTLIKAVAFVCGVYLSIRSGSRSGWLAFPIVIFGVFYISYKPKLWQTAFLVVLIFTILIGFYQLDQTIKSRTDAFFQQIVTYPWLRGLAPDSSVGMRVTFYRLGYYYFSQNPLFGWGERGYGGIKDSAVLLSFSTQYARDFAYSALFHSEWMTQSVRFGIFGLMGVFYVFWLPMKMFCGFLKLGREYVGVSCMGLAYMTCQFVASLGDEVFNSKGMITFTSIIIAGLLATGLSLQKNGTSPVRTGPETFPGQG